MASRRPSRGGRRSAPAPQSNAQQYMIVFGGVGGLLLVIVLVVMSGQKDKKQQPAPAANTSTKTTPAKTQTEKKPEPPAEVPAEFIRKVESAWPAIEKMGKEFEKNFAKARIAHKENNREVLQTEINAAQKAYEAAQDAWAPIYYSADDYGENVAEACRSWVKSYEKKVSGWTKQAKALKEFSTAD